VSVGDPGPYINDEGDVWVPRTVPWRDARRVASSGAVLDWDQRLQYVGKADVDLLGFSRDCYCDSYCGGRYDDTEPTGETPCLVPAWHFRIVEGNDRPQTGTQPSRAE
jgi:hypothetical protein